MKKKYFALTLCLGLTVPGVADDFDLFDQMDDSAVVETPKQKSRFEKIFDATDFKLQLNQYSFLHGSGDLSDEQDKRKHFANALFETRTKYIEGNNIFNLTTWLQEGNEHDTYIGGPHEFQDRDRYSRIFELVELNWVYSQGKNQYTLGKKKVKIGMSTLYSPADKYVVADANDPMQTKEIGIWQLRYDRFAGPITYSAILIPVYNESRTSSPQSRWSGTVNGESGNQDFYGIEDDKIEREIIDKKAENASILLRAKTIYRGWDLFAAGYYGVSPYAVLAQYDKTKETYTRQHPKAAVLSAGFSTTYKKFEFHGETYLQLTHARKDDDFINSVIGTTYTWDDWVKKIYLDKINFTLEYANEGKLRNQDHEDFVESSQAQRAGQNDILGRIDAKVNEDLSLEWLFSRNLDDDGYLHHYGVEYQVSSNISIQSYFDFFGGPDDSYYGKWDNNDRWFNTLEYRF
ncbi:MAG: hypothetical protein ACQESH_01655 [Campylobacterota bacterium]